MYVRGYIVFFSDQGVNNINSIFAYDAAETEQHTLFTYVKLYKMALRVMRRRQIVELKSLFLFSLCTKSILIAT